MIILEGHLAAIERVSKEIGATSLPLVATIVEIISLIQERKFAVDLDDRLTIHERMADSTSQLIKQSKALTKKKGRGYQKLTCLVGDFLSVVNDLNTAEFKHIKEMHQCNKDDDSLRRRIRSCLNIVTKTLSTSQQDPDIDLQTKQAMLVTAREFVVWSITNADSISQSNMPKHFIQALNEALEMIDEAIDAYKQETGDDR
jgi:hypothetical protein